MNALIYCLMIHRYLWTAVLAAGISFFFLTGVSCRSGSGGDLKEPPAAAREFRGVWVATVGNIDWPSRPGLSTAEQQKEAIQILDRCVATKMNAVIFQVRTACDALYDSKLEPWSRVLSGVEGQAPDPYYDPLKFWCDEAHKRGLELHAWFNPYRARPEGKYPHADSHISKTHPELVKKYGGMEWLDPGNEKGLQHTFAVFMDVVQRYDIDGVHMDDYFYPYPVRAHPDDRRDKTEAPFPDDDSYDRYRNGGGQLSRDDWRRENVNHLVRGLYEEIKAAKPNVKFGISPFGIWQPNNPPVVEGFDAYSKLYADTKLWLNKGWCDYWVPQLYWKMGSPHQPFLALTNWWAAQNTHHRNFYPGMYTGRVSDGPTGWAVDEVAGQIQTTRFAGGALGDVHFSMKVFLQNRDDICGQLVKGVYAYDVLPPASPWLDATRPSEPSVNFGVAAKSYAAQAAAPTTLPTIGGGYEPASRPAGTGFGRFGRRGRGGAASRPTSAPATAEAEVEEPLQRTNVFVVQFKPASDDQVFLWAVYTKADKKWTMRVFPAGTTEAPCYDTNKTRIEAVAVSAVNRIGNESDRVILERPANLEVTPVPPKVAK